MPTFIRRLSGCKEVLIRRNSEKTVETRRRVYSCVQVKLYFKEVGNSGLAR